MDKREHEERRKRQRREDREKFKEFESKGIKYSYSVKTCRDERVCTECQKLEGQEYSIIDTVPELPYAKCTNEKDGCRCSYSSDIVGVK